MNSENLSVIASYHSMNDNKERIYYDEHAFDDSLCMLYDMAGCDKELYIS